MANLSELAAAMNGRELTDQDGVIPEDLPAEESAPQEEVSRPSIEPEEKPHVEKSEEPKEEYVEADFAEDEQGRKYIPEDRFKKIYGKLKQSQRELENIRKQSQSVRQEEAPIVETPQAPVFVDRTVALETEMLYSKYPQFDENSPEYNRELDELGATIYQATGGTISKLEAARRALNTARKLAGQEALVRNETRNLKSQMSDAGITNRVVSRTTSAEPNVNDMSDKDLEAYLRKTGQW